MFPVFATTCLVLVVHVTPADCGAILSLSDSQPSVHVTSPGHPATYNPHLECFYFIEVNRHSLDILHKNCRLYTEECKVAMCQRTKALV